MITLKKGDTGSFVDMLQLALQRAGYNVPINGEFDEILENAVKEFQQTNNLDNDGIVGQKTWSLLEPYIFGYKTDENGNVTIFDFDVVPTNVRYTWDLVSYIVSGLAVRYQFVETGSIGKSVMGKDLYYLKIGKGEKEVLFNATHHANEWFTTPLLFNFAE